MMFASDRIADEWTDGHLSSMTTSILIDAQQFALARWQWTFFITCIYRTPLEDAGMEGSGIHTAWRAVDIRDKDVDPDAVADLTDYLNQTYIYDASRPWLTVCYSKPHGTGPHVHIQSHPATRKAPAGNKPPFIETA